MAKEKPGVMLYWETFAAIKHLDGDQTKTIIEAMQGYAQLGVVPDFTGDAALSIIWSYIKPRIDKDAERYEQKIEQRRQAGLASAAKRAENAESADTELEKHF